MSLYICYMLYMYFSNTPFRPLYIIYNCTHSYTFFCHPKRVVIICSDLTPTDSNSLNTVLRLTSCFHSSVSLKERDWVSGFHYAGSFCWFSASSYREESIKEENKSSSNTLARPLWHNAVIKHTSALQHIQCSLISPCNPPGCRTYVPLPVPVLTFILMHYSQT